MKKIKYFIKDQLKKLLGSVGYRIVPVRVIETYTVPDSPALKQYFEADKKANPENDRAGDDFTKERRFDTLYHMVAHVLDRQVSGDFAECGCKHGHSTRIISDLMAKAGTTSDLLVFDSFEGGLSDKTEKDRTNALSDTTAVKTRQQKQRFSSQLSHVENVFKDQPFVKLVKGWIPESFTPEIAEKTFSFAHIDVDLYEPTKAALYFFYERLSKGGVIVIDDYNSATFPGARTAVEEFLSDHKPSFFLPSQVMGCVIVK